jgi:hypothetical protein
MQKIAFFELLGLMVVPWCPFICCANFQVPRPVYRALSVQGVVLGAEVAVFPSHMHTHTWIVCPSVFFWRSTDILPSESYTSRTQSSANACTCFFFLGQRVLYCVWLQNFKVAWADPLFNTQTFTVQLYCITSTRPAQRIVFQLGKVYAVTLVFHYLNRIWK